MRQVTHRSLDAYVHIGAPKTGSTLIQKVLWRKRERLAKDGVLYPYASHTEHFPAMLDLCELRWGDIDPATVSGTWDRVAERVRGWDGRAAILSNELLGYASSTQISWLVDSLAPARVHVIYTARDLARQLVSSWQEQIKHRMPLAFEDFLTEIAEQGPDAGSPLAPFFWPLQQADHVLSRWSAIVGEDRVHVVTVPPPGAPSGTLWRRFCAATTLDPDRYPVQARRANVALSAPEAELFRRINTGLGDISARDYSMLVRRYLMRRVATGQGDQLTLPKEFFDRVHERSEDLVARLAYGGYHVIGDLDDLVPRPENHPEPATGASDAELLPLAISSTQLLLRLAAEQSAELRDLRSAAQPVAGGAPRPRATLRGRAGSLKRAVMSRVSRHRGRAT